MMGTVLELISATPPYVENRMWELRFSISCLQDRMVMKSSQFVFVPETGGDTLHPLPDGSLHWFWYVDGWLEVELAAPECLHHHLPHGAAAAVPQLARPRPHPLRCLHYHNCCPTLLLLLQLCVPASVSPLRKAFLWPAELAAAPPPASQVEATQHQLPLSLTCAVRHYGLMTTKLGHILFA